MSAKESKIKLKELLMVVGGVECYVKNEYVAYFTSSENTYHKDLTKYLEYIVEWIWVIDNQQNTIIQCELRSE